MVIAIENYWGSKEKPVKKTEWQAFEIKLGSQIEVPPKIF